jgi:uncharacterized membrane protein
LPAARILAGVVLIGYPALVWYGLTHWSPRQLALALLVVLLPTAALRLRGASRESLRGVAAVPLVTVCALGLAALLDASGYVLAVPVAINTVLLIGFGGTLRRGSLPMIERMARLSVSDLSEAERTWCRLWTWIWCGFFVVNGGTALVLALAAPLAWWALYNGAIAYALMGTLFATEWVLRRRRFGSRSDAAAGDDRAAPAPRADAALGDADDRHVGGAHDGPLPGAGA